MDKKTCLISGAQQGIGKAIAGKFNDNNYTVVTIDKSNNQNTGNYFCTDMTDYETLKTDLNLIKRHYGAIDCLVHCVGKMVTGSIKTSSAVDMIEAYKVNVLSVFNAVNIMTKNDMLKTDGSIVILGSNASIMGFSKMVPYCTTKSALVGFVQSVAKDLAPQSINVNLICPAPLYASESDMSKIQVEQFMENLDMTEEKVNEMLVSRIPMKRLCKNSDVANLAFFLCTGGNYITGQSISLTGGMVFR